jgi:hypothetical protein
VRARHQNRFPSLSTDTSSLEDIMSTTRQSAHLQPPRRPSQNIEWPVSLPGIA